MSKNKFTKLEEIPKEADLKKIVLNLEYKKVRNTDLPEPIIENGLISKCNSFIVTASGSAAGMLYSLVGIRPDGDNVDEHPIVYYYNYVNPSESFGGIIHHGDWDGRTTPLESEQINAMTISGLTADFTYKSIPPDASGSLED